MSGLLKDLYKIKLANNGERALKLALTVPPVVMARVQTHLALKRAQNNLKNQNQLLESAVQMRTRDLVAAQDKLENLIQTGLELGQERDRIALLRKILFGAKKMDAESGYRTVSMLTVPLSPREGEVIGVLQFLNALDPETGKIIPFSPELLRFVTAMAAQAAVTLDNFQLVEAQRELLDAMIKLIAGAIDAKSPYTGGHCERVPELGVMLAEAAAATLAG